MSADKIQPLVPSSNSLTTYNDWLAWKRGLIYYLASKEITDSARKKAVLLHKGGRELQEIFGAIEAADEKAAKEAKDPFEFALASIDQHFKPTTSKSYERFLFRRIVQGSDSIEQFVVKLRKQAANCKFASVEEAICDQIIDGTSCALLRQKILEQKLEKLQPILELGKLLEAVTIQTRSMGSEKNEQPGESVSRLSSSSSRASSLGEKVERRSAKKQGARLKDCYRCGSPSHEGNDPSCPAIESVCKRCDRRGHWASKCRTKNPELSGQSSRSADKGAQQAKGARGRDNQSKVRALDADVDGSSSETGDSFRLRANEVNTQAPSNRVPLRFAGVKIVPVIDSGADGNMIDPDTWRRLRRSGANFKVVPTNARIFPYGRKEALKFQCAVELLVESKSTAIVDKFFVLAEDEGDYEPIVGKSLATRLGVLKIGERVASVRSIQVREQSSKGKLKDVQLDVPLDLSVTPVAQQCRRIPFAVRKPLSAHLKNLWLTIL